jgi:hypothetical protein
MLWRSNNLFKYWKPIEIMIIKTLNNKRSKSWYIAKSIIFLDITHHLVGPNWVGCVFKRNKTMDNVQKCNTCDEQYFDCIDFSRPSQLIWGTLNLYYWSHVVYVYQCEKLVYSYTLWSYTYFLRTLNIKNMLYIF